MSNALLTAPTIANLKLTVAYHFYSPCRRSSFQGVKTLFAFFSPLFDRAVSLVVDKL
jgi:hypothetical protein